MKKIFVLIAILFLGLGTAFAQNGDKEPTMEELAERHTKDLVKKIGLSDSQEFYVDSILRTNYLGVKAALEDLQRSGRQEPDIYRHCRELWQQKSIDALKKVLDEQQYIGYLRYIGKGREYKKGKDGKWYLKSELKKNKK